MGNLYDVYFTLNESASMVIEANSKEEAARAVHEMDTDTLLERMRYAVDYKGTAITHVETIETNIDRPRLLAIEILDMFEDVLDEHGILVPDEDRTGAEGEACLYGMTYGRLEDAITDMLAEYIEE